MVMKRLKVASDFNIFSDQIMLAFMKYENGERYMAKIKWQLMEEGVQNEDIIPTFTLESDEKDLFFKSLVEELERLGVLKESATVAALTAEVIAKDKHIEDLQKMVFKGKSDD